MGFGKKLLGVADNVAKEGGKAAVHGGEEVVSGARSTYGPATEELLKKINGAGGVADEATEAVTKQVDTIMDDLAKVRNAGSTVSLELAKDIKKANSALNSASNLLSADVKAAANRRDIIAGKLNTWSSLKDKSGQENVGEWLVQRLKGLDAEVELGGRKIKELNIIQRMATTPGQEAAAVQRAASSAVDGVDDILIYWSGQMKDVLNANRELLRLTSKNLGNDTKFLQEYLTLKRNPGAAAQFARWAGNPANAKKINELHSSDKIFDIISAGKMTRKQKFFGITKKDMAKRIGGTAVAGAGAVGIYSWFSGNNNPAAVANQGTKLAQTSQSVEATGTGGRVLADVKKHLDNITSLSSATDKKLSTDEAPQATEAYIKGMTTSVVGLLETMKYWPIVVKNSNNPEAAKAQGKRIFSFINDQISGLGELAAQLGVDINLPQIPQEQSTPDIAGASALRSPDADNLMKIQSFLQLNKSGSLDAATVKSLKKLEGSFNSRAKTSHFTGAFIVPEIGYVISYDNLVTAYKKVQKYN